MAPSPHLGSLPAFSRVSNHFPSGFSRSPAKSSQLSCEASLQLRACPGVWGSCDSRLHFWGAPENLLCVWGRLFFPSWILSERQERSLGPQAESRIRGAQMLPTWNFLGRKQICSKENMFDFCTVAAGSSLCREGRDVSYQPQAVCSSPQTRIARVAHFGTSVCYF